MQEICNNYSSDSNSFCSYPYSSPPSFLGSSSPSFFVLKLAKASAASSPAVVSAVSSPANSFSMCFCASSNAALNFPAFSESPNLQARVRREGEKPPNPTPSILFPTRRSLLVVLASSVLASLRSHTNVTYLF